MTERQIQINYAYEKVFGRGNAPAYGWLKSELLPDKIFEMMLEATKTGIELRREDLYPDWVINMDPDKIY